MNTHRRVLLVDDERLARQRLRQLLAAAPDFDVVGECSDARDVPAMVVALQPDVIFLDVGMPFHDGFTTHALVSGSVRHIVFVTAHPEHAARAWDVEAADYLVKPVTQARFDSALARLRRAPGDQDEARILLGSRQGGDAVFVKDIHWAEADGAYVLVHTAQRRYVLRESLTQFLSRLRHAPFMRIHRSTVINLEEVQRVCRHDDGGLVVELTSALRLPISRRKAREVVARLRRDRVAAYNSD